jgi:anion-transporting  ArsA/GET3 family ATPase
MATGFRDRAQSVSELLTDRNTTFMLVTAPEREPIDEAIFFWQRLDEAKLPFAGVVVNKVHHDYLSAAAAAGSTATGVTLDKLAVELERSLDGSRENAELAEKVRENFERYRVLAERDRQNIDRLTRELDAEWVIEVPYLDEDVCDIGGLAEVNRYLFSSAEERQAILAQARA